MPRGIYKRTEKYKKESRIRTKEHPELGFQKGHPKYYFKHTEETLDKIRKNSNIRYWLGKKHPISEETKKKLRESWVIRTGLTTEERAGIRRQKTKQKRLKLRFQIFTRDNFTCQYCGRKSPKVILEIDHKYPKSKGGKDNIDNYITACGDCNRGKGDSILTEFLQIYD